MTATKTVQELAAEMVRRFEVKKRDDDTQYVTLRGGSPDWMKEVCHKAHGDDFLPDDFRYETIAEACGWIADASGLEEDSSAEFADETTDICTTNLAAWMASSLNRVEYCNEAISEGLADGSDQAKTMMAGQYMEREEVFSLLVKALEEIAEDDD